jgi:hypothetical protein
MQELGKALPKLYLKYRAPLDPKKTKYKQL